MNEQDLIYRPPKISRRLLIYFLLDWLENHYERRYLREEPDIPDDLAEGISDLKEEIDENLGIDVDAEYGYRLAQSDTYLTYEDVLVLLLRENSKYWHEYDEDYHFKCFDRQGKAYLDRLKATNGKRSIIVLCLLCHTRLRSTGRYNFQQCDCRNKTFADSGDAYHRSGGVDITKVQIEETRGYEWI